MDKKISIIMPLYNCEKYVEESILSVINQTYSNWELIICDDCSTDSSYSIAKNYAEKDKRIKVLHNEMNSGSAVARNNALDVATGDYVGLLDSDDMYDPSFIEKQLEFIGEDKQFVFCSFRRLAANSTTVYTVPDQATYKQILKGSCLTPLSVFIKRDLIGDTRFEKDSLVEDFVFFLELLKKTDKAIGNKEVLATYRIVENSKSRNKKKLIKKMWIVYHKELKFNFFKAALYLFCWGIHGLYKYRNVK